MPPVRRRSLLPKWEASTQEETPRPSLIIPESTIKSQITYPSAQRQALSWLAELQKDVDPATGYLIARPTTEYGKKVKELVQYSCSQSSEVKSIQTSRRLRRSPCCLYTLHLLRFLADYVIPVVVALLVSVHYYTSIQAPQEDDPPAVPLAATWTDTATTAGSWLGESIRYATSIPLSFVASTIDSTLHVSQGVQYLAQRTELIVYTPLLFVATYLATLVLIRLFLNLYTLCSAEQTLWNYQELILKETFQGAERAITGILRPALVAYYEAFAITSGSDQYVMTHATLCERLSNDIRAKTLAELLLLGNVSATYIHSLHMLIRHADAELSAAMFQFIAELGYPRRAPPPTSGSEERAGTIP